VIADRFVIAHRSVIAHGNVAPHVSEGRFYVPNVQLYWTNASS